MEEDRIPKILLYSELHEGKRNVGRPILRYKDKLKSNLKCTNIPNETFEISAGERQKWRHMSHEGVKSFERNRLEHLISLRRGVKERSAVPALQNVFICNICYLSCKSVAGLKSHTA